MLDLPEGAQRGCESKRPLASVRIALESKGLVSNPASLRSRSRCVSRLWDRGTVELLACLRHEKAGISRAFITTVSGLMHEAEFELPDYSQTRLNSVLNDGQEHLTLASPKASPPLSENLPF